MRGGHLKLLGLSLLALVGVMAVSASAAQAKWLLLLDKTSVLTQSFHFTADPMEFLVPELGISIACEGGTGIDGTELNGSHTVQSGAMIVELTGCQMLELGEVCSVHGVGDPNGTVTAEAAGIASMEGETVLITSTSSAFANVEFSGEECPLIEIDGRIGGTLVFEVGNPLSDVQSHKITLVEQELSFAGHVAEFHDGGEGAPSGTIETTGGQTAAMHLVEL